MSIYPGQEFNRDDESIVNLGYWDPEAADDSVPEENLSNDSALNHGTDSQPVLDSTVTEPTVGNQPNGNHLISAPENPWENPEQASSYVSHKLQEPVVAASSDMISRVELAPGGVKSAIEAILAVAEVPVSTREFAAALLVSERAVEAAIDELYTEYNGYTSADGIAHEPRGFELRPIDGGWRLYARADFSPWVGRFVTGAQSKKLTQAQLETLAVIAYQQPVTRTYVSQVCGVSVDVAFRILKQRGLITETVPEEGTGAPQYITTHEFLQRLGLESTRDLPKLAPFLPDINDIEMSAENP